MFSGIFHAQLAPEPSDPVLKSVLQKIIAFNEQKLELFTGFSYGLHGAAEAKRRSDFYLAVDKEIKKIDLQQLNFKDLIFHQPLRLMEKLIDRHIAAAI